MNIFFCDGCGIRVTETDLRSGHGVRRKTEVFCPDCVNKGKGTPGVLSPAAPAPASSASVQPVAVKTPLPAVDPLPSAAPFAAAAPPAAATPPPASAAREHEKANENTARLPARSQDLSAAVSGFSAMSQPIATSERAAAARDASSADDLIDEADAPDAKTDTHREVKSKAATAELTDAAADATTPGKHETDAGLEAVQAADAAAADASDAKGKPPTRATVRADRVPPPSSPANRAATASRSSTASRASTASRSSTASRASTSTKSGHRTPTPSSSSNRTPTPGRASGRGKTGPQSGRKLSNKDRKMLAFSVVGIAALLAIFLVISLMQDRKPRQQEQPREINYLSELNAQLVKARDDANAALNRDPKSLDELNKARASLLAFQEAINKFEKRMRTEQKWTEENVNTQLSQLNASDVNMLMRNINDERIKLMNH